MRAAYFTVALVLGREVPAIWWDELPRAPIRDLVYVVRLDQLPHGEALCAAPLCDLYAVYCHLKKRGKLPPKWEPPPRPKAEAATAKAGHREVHVRRYLPDLPYEEPWVKGGE